MRVESVKSTEWSNGYQKSLNSGERKPQRQARQTEDFSVVFNKAVKEVNKRYGQSRISDQSLHTLF